MVRAALGSASGAAGSSEAWNCMQGPQESSRSAVRQVLCTAGRCQGTK